MITKERLEELIQQEATIYTVKYNYKDMWIIKLSNKSEIKIYDNEHYLSQDSEAYPLKYLHETKDRAEHALKYENLPRTEYLSLPYWEDLKNNNEDIDFGNYTIHFSDFIKITHKYGDFYWCELLTKNNYEKACEIAKKLWLWERV